MRVAQLYNIDIVNVDMKQKERMKKGEEGKRGKE
jgi:hypothetical protein